MKSEKVTRVKRLLSILLVNVFVLCCVCPVQAAEVSVGEPREVLKAGFFSWDGYHVQDANGVKSGYGYDFLKMTEAYCNWSFDFVGYDKTWSDMLEMLDSGEIDVLTSAQKTPEWEEKYAYTDQSIGTSATILSVMSTEDEYVIGDPSTYDGMVIGSLSGSSRNERFQKFADENGFQFTFKFYNNLGELKVALRTGKVDGMLGTNLRSIQGETVLETLDPVDYYAIVRKEDTELLEKLNHAISEMNLNTPSWRETLQQKYFTNKEEETLVFDKAELEYLQELKDSRIRFKVVTNPDLAPYSSFDEEGNAVGIAPTIFREMAKRIGLKYEFIPTGTYEEYNSYVRDGKADIDLTCFNDYGLAADSGINLTNPYMNTAFALLKKENFKGKIDKLAELSASSHNTTYFSEMEKMAEIVYYDTNAACVQAVLDGKVDGTYLYTYTAQKAVQEDVKNRLSYAIIPKYEIDISMGVKTAADYRLTGILNEGIRCLEGDYIQGVIHDEIIQITEEEGLLSVLYDNPESVVLGIVFVAFMLLAITYSVIRRKQAEKELVREAEIGKGRTEFFMMISHELRTPLNAVVGYLGMLTEEHKKNNWNMEYVRRTKRAAMQLTDIADSMLEYTHISAGDVKLQNKTFDFRDVIQSGDQNISIKAKEKNQAYSLKVQPIAFPYLYGDPLRLEQIFQNILSNAVKFTREEGRIEVEVAQEETEDHRVRLMLTCKDTGKGMSQEFIRQVCSPFQQSDSAYSRTHGGMGLGLFLTKYFVNVMDGKMEITSEEGVGSCVKITVLVEKSPESQKMPEQEKTAKLPQTSELPKTSELPQTLEIQDRPDFSGIHALIVEDNKTNAYILSRILKKSHITTKICENGKLAVEEFEKEPKDTYQIIFMDIQMPVMNGYEAARKIRASRNHQGVKIPIVAVSANAFPEDVRQSLDSGMNAHLSKPINVKQLFEEIAQLC